MTIGTDHEEVAYEDRARPASSDASVARPSREKVVDNLAQVRSRIEAACRKSGRDPAGVRLLLATKTVPPDLIRVAIEAGASLIGENKVQEFAAKHSALKDLECERHFIGHLQSNKINDVLKYVTCIQSVDSLPLAQKLDRRLQQEGRALDVFVQVNTSLEDSKFGVSPDAAVELVRDASRLGTLRIRGLMTIGLLFSHGDAAQRCLVQLRQIRDRIVDLGLPAVDLQHLSMGMSPDIEQAIQEGSTMVRVGMSVFGRRPTPDGFFWKESDREG